MLETAGAACKWANLPFQYEVVHALNIKAGITNPANFYGLNAICNILAGTTNNSAVSALRSINV
jgi:hypothetical protein